MSVAVPQSAVPWSRNAKQGRRRLARAQAAARALVRAGEAVRAGRRTHVELGALPLLKRAEFRRCIGPVRTRGPYRGRGKRRRRGRVANWTLNSQASRRRGRGSARRRSSQREGKR